MTDEDFLAQLREAFAVEAAEHVQAIVTGLLELEKAPPAERQRELVETIFRDAHSLKGAARAVDRGDIESVCQALESVFAAWKREERGVPVETFDTLNRAVDLVSGLLAHPGGKGATLEMVKQLGALASGQGAPPAPSPSAPPPPAPAPVAERPAVSETVRIPMARMDALLLEAEELLAVKLALRQHKDELHGTLQLFDEWRRDRSAESGAFIHSLEQRLGVLTKVAEHDERALGTLVDNLLEDTKQLVMLPFARLLDIFPKLVRDFARDEGKEIELTLEGREVELDKRILEEMKDPLIHLVRNALDHGVEKPAARLAAGKPAKATLTISVAQRDGGKVEIVVRDDGAGIDAARVRASAVKSGLLRTAEAAEIGDDEALQLIFQSGLSTSPIITAISGRGLGMAIVRDKTEKLGGQINVSTRAGGGTTFRILLPVTLATFKGVLVEVGSHCFVIPTANIEHIVRVASAGVRTVEGRETIEHQGRALALVRVGDVLGIPRSARPAAPLLEALVLGAGEKRIAFVVDEVRDEQEVLVKNLGHPLRRVRNVAGATVLGAGTPVLILHAADLLKSAVKIAPGSVAGPAAEDTSKVARILVADDSLTSRMLLKNILEAAGYVVTTAVDGREAFTTLRSGEFDLVVSDVEMPRLDGFGLTADIRADQRLAELPVVLVTALSSREHQERGIDAGANAYIVKGSFDQTNLLETIRRLL